MIPVSRRIESKLGLWVMAVAEIEHLDRLRTVHHFFRREFEEFLNQFSTILNNAYRWKHLYETDLDHESSAIVGRSFKIGQQSFESSLLRHT